MLNDSRQIVAEIPKNTTEKIIISKTEYCGQTFVDFRIWWLPDGAVDHIATKKGVAIKIGNLSELIAMLQTLDADLMYLEIQRGAA